MIMRSQFLSNMLAGAALTLVLPQLFSCSLKETEAVSGGIPDSFRAETVQDYISEEFKSTVNISAKTTTFAAGDEVVVTDGNNEATYRTASGGAAGAAVFTRASGTAPANYNTATTFFPSSMKSGRDGKVLQLNLDWAQQDCRSVSSLSDLPMYGRFSSDGSTCRFYNLCTILRITAVDGTATPDAGLVSAVFTSHEVGITGAATFTDGKLLMAADAGRTITLDCTSALGTSVWSLKLPAQTYPGGFELVLTFSNGKTYTYSTTKTITLQPGYISTMDAFTCDNFSGGSGSAVNPYRIASKADWEEMVTKTGSTASYRSAHYVLTNNIKFAADGSYGDLGTVAPSNDFTGSFDGQGYTISNIAFTHTDSRCALFGILSGATVKNLNVSNAKMKTRRGKNDSAIIAARSIDGSVIEGCNLTNVSVLSDSCRVGAITGFLDASTIRNCTASNVTIEGNRNPASTTCEFGVGGLVGWMKNSSTVSGCAFSGDVSSSKNNVGGLIGLINGGTTQHTIENCHFTGSVTGSASVGGIISDISSRTRVRNCSVTVPSGTAISGIASNVAGLVAFVTKNEEYDGFIDNCVFQGAVTSSGGNRVAGIVANDQAIPVYNCRVENATISGAGTQVGGAVAQITGQTIRNVIVSNSSVTGSRIVGGLVASVDATSAANGGGQVLDCAVENTPVQGTKKDLTSSTKYAYVGGIVGLIQNSGDATPLATRIVRCHTSGSYVKSPGLGVGGIAGVIGYGGAATLIDECWSDETVTSLASDLDGSLIHSGMTGGIVGEIAQGTTGNLVINCTYYGGSVSCEGPNYGSVGGIAGLMVYAYAVGDVTDNAVVNCFSNPASVSTGGHLGAGGIGGDMCRFIVDNCCSPISSAHLSSQGTTQGSILGRMNRGGRVVNSYYTFQGEGSHTAGGATEDTWRMTSLTDEQMRAAAATVTIPTTGTNAASLTDALNKGAALYNDGGDGIAHHGTLPYGVRAKAWAKGSYPYPVLVDSPLCDVNPEDYARTIVLEDPDPTIFLPPRK